MARSRMTLLQILEQPKNEKMKAELVASSREALTEAKGGNVGKYGRVFDQKRNFKYPYILTDDNLFAFLSDMLKAIFIKARVTGAPPLLIDVGTQKKFVFFYRVIAHLAYKDLIDSSTPEWLLRTDVLKALQWTQKGDRETINKGRVQILDSFLQAESAKLLQLLEKDPDLHDSAEFMHGMACVTYASTLAVMPFSEGVRKEGISIEQRENIINQFNKVNGDTFDAQAIFVQLDRIKPSVTAEELSYLMEGITEKELDSLNNLSRDLGSKRQIDPNILPTVLSRILPWVAVLFEAAVSNRQDFFLTFLEALTIEKQQQPKFNSERMASLVFAFAGATSLHASALASAEVKKRVIDLLCAAVVDKNLSYATAIGLASLVNVQNSKIFNMQLVNVVEQFDRINRASKLTLIELSYLLDVSRDKKGKLKQDDKKLLIWLAVMLEIAARGDRELFSKFLEALSLPVNAQKQYPTAERIKDLLSIKEALSPLYLMRNPDYRYTAKPVVRQDGAVAVTVVAPTRPSSAAAAMAASAVSGAGGGGGEEKAFDKIDDDQRAGGSTSRITISLVAPAVAAEPVVRDAEPQSPYIVHADYVKRYVFERIDQLIFDAVPTFAMSEKKQKAVNQLYDLREKLQTVNTQGFMPEAEAVQVYLEELNRLYEGNELTRDAVKLVTKLIKPFGESEAEERIKGCEKIVEHLAKMKTESEAVVKEEGARKEALLKRIKEFEGECRVLGDQGHLDAASLRQLTERLNVVSGRRAWLEKNVETYWSQLKGKLTKSAIEGLILACESCNFGSHANVSAGDERAYVKHLIDQAIWKKQIEIFESEISPFSTDSFSLVEEDEADFASPKESPKEDYSLVALFKKIAASKAEAGQLEADARARVKKIEACQKHFQRLSDIIQFSADIASVETLCKELGKENITKSECLAKQIAVMESVVSGLLTAHEKTCRNTKSLKDLQKMRDAIIKIKQLVPDKLDKAEAEFQKVCDDFRGKSGLVVKAVHRYPSGAVLIEIDEAETKRINLLKRSVECLLKLSGNPSRDSVNQYDHVRNALFLLLQINVTPDTKAHEVSDVIKEYVRRCERLVEFLDVADRVLSGPAVALVTLSGNRSGLNAAPAPAGGGAAAEAKHPDTPAP